MGSVLTGMKRATTGQPPESRNGVHRPVTAAHRTWARNVVTSRDAAIAARMGSAVEIVKQGRALDELIASFIERGGAIGAFDAAVQTFGHHLEALRPHLVALAELRRNPVR
ncbi:hypothetical protein ACQQ2N_04730 [Dokdonella sp. MW10]|uniref:hypothetical protein n=1 Tax=Dokdonella sp. MW10 TaxID=2992926 RepID=UPI003F7F21AC